MRGNQIVLCGKYRPEEGKKELKRKMILRKGSGGGGPAASVRTGRGGMEILDNDQKGGKFLYFVVPKIFMEREIPI